MTSNSVITKLATRKKLITIITAVVLVPIIILFVVFYLNRNYLIDYFAPQERINFTVFTGEGPTTELFRRQLVIENYRVNSNEAIPRNAKVLVEDSLSRIVTQQKAHGFSYVCKGEHSGECSVRETGKGQKYTYTTDIDRSRDDPNFIDEWIHFEKDGTDIVVHRNEHKSHPMNTASWNSYVDSFQPMPKNELKHFFRVGSKEVPFAP